MVAMMWNSGCHSPALRFTETAASGTTWPSITTSLEPVPRMPSVRQLSITFTCGRIHRNAEMQHLRRLAFALQHRAGHQEVAGGRARRKHLSRGDAIAAVDFLGLAGAADPVGAAARQQDDALGRDALEQRLDRAPPSAPSSARRESRPGGCAWKTPARWSRNDARACAASRRVRRHRRRRRQVRWARRPRPGPPPSARQNCRRRTGPRRWRSRRARRTPGQARGRSRRRCGILPHRCGVLRCCS